MSTEESERQFRAADARMREFDAEPIIRVGGELGALVIIDAVSRLRDGVLGNPDSPLNESFTGEPLLEHPQYTRPREFRGQEVPEILLSGDHGKVARW